MIKKIIIIGTIITSLSVFSYSVDQVTLESLTKAAQKNNAQIIAARERWQASESRITQERTLDYPKLTIEYWSIPESTFDLESASEKMYGFDQMIPFPGKLRARGKTAQYEAEGMKWDYKNTELGVLSEVKTTYAKYYTTYKALNTYQQTAQIMQSFSTVAASRYSVGKSGQNDVLRAQVEAEKMTNMVTTLELEKEAIRAQLNFLAGMPVDYPLGDPEDLSPRFIKIGWDEIRQLALASSPDIRRVNAAVSRSAWARHSASLGYLPDFDIGFRRKKVDEVWSGSDFMAGVIVPLWFWKQRAAVKEAEDNAKAAEYERKNTELMVLSQAKDAYTKLQSGRRLIELYTTSIIPKAEQTLKVTQASYTAGSMNFLELLDSVRSYLEFNLEYYNAIADYEKNLAMLERTVGVSLGE